MQTADEGAPFALVLAGGLLYRAERSGLPREVLAYGPPGSVPDLGATEQAATVLRKESIRIDEFAYSLWADDATALCARDLFRRTERARRRGAAGRRRPLHCHRAAAARLHRAVAREPGGRGTAEGEVVILRLGVV